MIISFKRSSHISQPQPWWRVQQVQNWLPTIYFLPTNPASIISSIPLKSLNECERSPQRILPLLPPNLPNALFESLALKVLGIVEGRTSCCFLNIFATWLPAGDTERGRERETGHGELHFLNGFRPLAFQQQLIQNRWRVLRSAGLQLGAASVHD